MTRTLTTATVALVVVAGFAAPRPRAQARAAFEVASIKENRSGRIFETFFYQYPAWMPDGMTQEQLESLPRDERPEEVTLFEAVERQAGLKLEPSRAVMKVLVIDQVEHPTAN